MTDTNDIQNDSTVDTAKQWVEENLRLIISIIIVVAIAGGIYSYSQRSEQTEVAFDDETTQEQVLIDGEVMEEDGDGVTSSDTTTTTQDDTSRDTTGPARSTTGVTRETEGSFVESAEAGNGVTHLARRALAHSLEKSPDSQLTAAHKIYIEDYLRKNVGFSGSVHIGTEVEFSKALINDAIEQSKTLTDAQLQNLQKYVVLVPSLT